MATAGNWIWRGNLEPLVAELERLSGDELDLGVRKVLFDDIAASDHDAVPPRWASQSFEGERSIVADFAADPGTQVLQVRVTADEKTLEQLRVLLGVMNSYHLRGPGAH